MMIQNATVVRRAVEHVWNRGDLTLADNLFGPTYINHGGLITDLVPGPEAIKMSVSLYRLAFPGLSISIDHLVTDGDVVDLGWAAHSNSGDDSAGRRADHDSEGLTGSTRSRLVDGQIVESWTTWDREDALRRLARAEEAALPNLPRYRSDG